MVRQKKASEGCACTPDPVTGKCCATNRCGCRKNGESRAGGYCSSACQCHRPLCACEGGNHTAIELIVKREGLNKGRRFYKCRKREGGCNYFQWATPPLLERTGRLLGEAENNNAVIDLISDDEDDNVISNADSNAQGYFVSLCVNQFGSRGAAPLSPVTTKSRSSSSGAGGPFGQKPSNNGGRKRKRCAQGSKCPYQHEYQHNLEFSHDGDEAVPGSGWGIIRKKPGGGGGSSGGSGNRKPFQPFGGTGNKLGGL